MNSKMSYATYSFASLPRERETFSLTDLNPITNEDGFTLMSMARNFLDSSDICPKRTSAELRQKTKQTLLYALCQNTVSRFMRAYISQMTELSSEFELPFTVTPSEVDIIISPVINPETAEIIPYAFIM